nr:MAG TPA: hypothetical protein [Crassvirales sp.]
MTIHNFLKSKKINYLEDGVGVYPLHDYTQLFKIKKNKLFGRCLIFRYLWLKIKGMKEKSYNLFGSTWKVQFVDEVVDSNNKWLIVIISGCLGKQRVLQE